MQVAFVCSAGHSGSTLLDLLLGSHPQAVSLGEITQLPKNLALDTQCTCGANARACEFWQQVVRRMKTHPEFRRIDEDPYVLHLGFIYAGTVIDRRHQTRLRQLYRKVLYALSYAHLRWNAPALSAGTLPLRRGAENKLILFEEITSLLGRDMLIDSSKHYLEAVSLYKARPDAVRIVLLVRDGRAVYYSELRRGRPRNTAVHVWQRHYQRALPLLERHVRPEHMIQVRYEDLAQAPDTELARICEFLGRQFDPHMLQFADSRHHVLNGNRMRFSADSTIRLDQSWRQKLTPQDMHYFDAKAGSFNRRLGYT